MGIPLLTSDDSTKRVEFQLVGAPDPSTGERPVENHFVDLRTDISSSDWADIDNGFISKMGADQSFSVRIADVNALQRALWIKAWSFTNNRGAPIKPDVNMMHRLRGPIGQRIGEIVDEHEEEMRELRDEKVGPTPPETSSTEEDDSQSQASPDSGTD